LNTNVNGFVDSSPQDPILHGVVVVVETLPVLSHIV
jgi:hypothetical protein